MSRKTHGRIFLRLIFNTHGNLTLHLIVYSLFSGGLVLYALCHCIFTPIVGWDPRSIWFFHAKIIFFNGGLYFSDIPGWYKMYFHFDYPKMVAIMSGQVASALGYWNEYLPKFSIFCLYLPSLLFISKVKKKNWLVLCTVLLTVIVIDSQLYNGYVDALLGVYFICSLLGTYFFIEKKESLFFVTGILFASILPFVKNEGLVLFAISLAYSASSMIIKENRKILSKRQLFAIFIYLLIVVLGIISWELQKITYGFLNSSGIGTEKSVTKFLMRYNDIWKHLKILEFWVFKAQLYYALLPFLILGCYPILKKKKIVLTGSYQGFIGFSISLLSYLSILYFVYLSTPHNLDWHLETSAWRVLLPVKIGFLALSSLLLKNFKRNPN